MKPFAYHQPDQIPDAAKLLTSIEESDDVGDRVRPHQPSADHDDGDEQSGAESCGPAHAELADDVVEHLVGATRDRHAGQHRAGQGLGVF